MLNAELLGKKIRQGSQRMFVDVVKEDMHRVGVTEEDTGDIAHLSKLIKKVALFK